MINNKILFRINPVIKVFLFALLFGGISFSSCCDDPEDIVYRMPGLDCDPAWSPDGKTIAFIRDFGNYYCSIYLIDTNGRKLRPVKTGIGAQNPEWSPDSKWIVFDWNSQIYKIKINGDSLTLLTTADCNYYPSFSPDGQWIIYSHYLNNNYGQAGVWIMKSDGSQQHRISDGDYPAWHPDGNTILAVIPDSGNYTKFIKHHLNDTIPDDTIPVIVGAENLFCKYSPDGQKIVFQSIGASGGVLGIYTMNSDGTDIQRIFGSNSLKPSWSADGEWIVFMHYQGRLWKMRNNGADRQQLTFNEYIEEK